MHQLFISERLSGDTTILELDGDVIFGDNVGRLRAEIRRLLAAGRKNITIDFKNAGFVDSSGVGELISALTAVNREDGRLRLINLSPRVYKLLEISRLLTVFDVGEQETTATSGLR
jgi:anti-sigma B factor antagonist